MVRRPTVAVFALLSLLAGCEGARENGLLDGLDGAAADDAGIGIDADGAADEDASGGHGDATVPDDGSLTEPTDATTPKDGAGTQDGGRDAKPTDGATDARTTDASDAGPKADASDDAGDGSREAGDGSGDAGDAGASPERVIACGSFECAVGTEVCCRTRNSVTTVFTCTPVGACPTNADASVLAIPCDHNDDCAAAGMIGSVCCVEFASARISSVSCKPLAACAFDTDTTSYVCDPDRNDAFNCPAPTGTDLECGANPSAAFPYGICREM